MKNTTHEEQMADMVELDEKTLPLWKIEQIASSRKTREQYERRYKDRLYSLILLSLTHESFKEIDRSLFARSVQRGASQAD